MARTLLEVDTADWWLLREALKYYARRGLRQPDMQAEVYELLTRVDQARCEAKEPAAPPVCRWTG